jgi:hypothetical protein
MQHTQLDLYSNVAHAVLHLTACITLLYKSNCVYYITVVLHLTVCVTLLYKSNCVCYITVVLHLTAGVTLPCKSNCVCYNTVVLHLTVCATLLYQLYVYSNVAHTVRCNTTVL